MNYIADILVIRQLIYCVSLQSIHWENWKHFLNKSKSLKQFCDVMDEENEKSAQNSDDTDYETDEEALGNHFQHDIIQQIIPNFCKALRHLEFYFNV